MLNPRILISGASIAGPAQAFWLHRYGFAVTVVEKTKALRSGGQAVDFKGPVHRNVLRKMGILDACRAAHVVDADGHIVSASGRRVGLTSGAFSGGEINVPRGDLSRIIYDLTADKCEYMFGDSIAAMTETAAGVDVKFASGAEGTYDLVIGADGLHSRVRKLAFGPEEDYVSHLGYYYALADIDAGDDNVIYNEPGRCVAIGGSKSPAFFIFASDPLPPTRDNVDAQKRQLADAYTGGRWRIPELLAKLPAARDFYLDSISRVTMDRYTHGRIALVGDAAWGNALGGYGTGLAVVGAHVLAGELKRSNGDHKAGFANYEKKIREYASVSQKINAGRLLAPRSWAGIVGRNALFTAATLVVPIIKLLEGPAKNIQIDDYEEAKSKIDDYEIDDYDTKTGATSTGA